MNTPEDLENLFIAISQQLYLEPRQKDYEENWKTFVNDPKFQKYIPKVRDTLRKISDQLFADLLDIDNFEKPKEINLLNLMWRICIYHKSFRSNHDQDTQEGVREFIRKAIREALASPLPESQVNLSDQNSSESPQQTPASATANWNYLPVEKAPDMHQEFDCKSGTSPEELNIIGARVRGKAHKHQGTNCDDWFEFKVSGDWTIIAVSDGAGSKKFSRIGAEASCQAAVQYLAKKLDNFPIEERHKTEDLSDSLKRDQDWVFSGKDIEYVQKCLHRGIEEAYKAVEQAATQRQGQPEYYQILNKELEVNDLSATLLLAVHTTVKAGGKPYSLILTCQIGDGMLAALSYENRLTLLGKPDSGEYGGQTEFLTSKNKLQRANLVQKTFVFAGDLKALMVMTDGVADDYFPSDPGILALYGDLVLNQVIPPEPQDREIVNDELRKTKLGTIQGVEDAKDNFISKIERIIDHNTINEPKEVNICSVDDYAKALGKTVAEVVASGTLLAAVKAQMYPEWHDKSPKEKLQLWLDSYYRRASFDDRTLVILYR
ncbi:MAG: PP2C family serine/threonine-protein phosphatase [Nostoc sp. ChiQUE01a]|nr:PP2C family serine/threonine-protein phosphatase [Nostoc sp. ChiQUE01a]